MSTKLYNGYRIIRADGTRPDLFAVITDLQPRLTEAHRLVGGKLLTEMAVMIHNEARSSELPPIGQAWLDLTSTAQKLAESPYRNGGLDLEFSVVFLHDPADDGALYAMLFTEVPEFREAWEATEGVEPWPYWDNVDPPEGVTDAEWDKRRDTWDRVIGWDAPAVRGVTFDPIQAMGRVPMPSKVRGVALAVLGDEALVEAIYTAGAQ